MGLVHDEVELSVEIFGALDFDFFALLIFFILFLLVLDFLFLPCSDEEAVVSLSSYTEEGAIASSVGGDLARFLLFLAFFFRPRLDEEAVGSFSTEIAAATQEISIRYIWVYWGIVGYTRGV